MAKATVTERSWGYYITGGGTDATVVTADSVQVKGILLTAVADTADIITVATGDGDTIVYNNPSTITSTFVDLKDVRLPGITVTLAQTSGVCCVFVI
jgi:hypothetical protein